MKTTPLVSVLMTAYNREQFIPEAIESVLSSTYTNFELIINDDGSTDRTVAVAQEYQRKDDRIKIFRNEKNLGDYINRNKVASYATGKYIKYLDSDDIMYPHCLQVMVYCMEQFPGAGFGLCSMADVDKPLPVISTPPQTYWEHFFGYSHFDRSPGSAIVLLDAFRAVGSFSGKRWIGDTELWFKLGKKYNLVKMPTGLFWDRQHNMQERNIEVDKQNKILSGQMRKELFEEMLSAPDCPLSAPQKEAVRIRMKKQKIKSRLFSLLPKKI